MNTYCFDWGGAIEANESLRDLARRAYTAGHRVFLVPALGRESTHPYEELMHQYEVPHNGIYRVYTDGAYSDFQVGFLKLGMLLMLHAKYFFDDLAANVVVARKYGIESFLVTPETKYDTIQV